MIDVFLPRENVYLKAKVRLHVDQRESVSSELANKFKDFVGKLEALVEEYKFSAPVHLVQGNTDKLYKNGAFYIFCWVLNAYFLHNFNTFIIF